MTVDEAAAWVRAGDFTTVAGIRLPESVSKKFAEVLSSSELPPDDEVAGFAVPTPSPAPVPIPYPNLGLDVGLSAIYKKSCAQGTHLIEAKLT
jgi:hypothetical protein